jgi:hypothetical protein
MLQPFDSLPSDARIWIYQSDRFFTAGEKKELESRLSEFVEKWTAHQRELSAGFSIVHDLFIIIGIDEKMAMASGCSIDKSVHIIRQLEADLKLSLLDRSRIACRKNDKVISVSKKEFENLLSTGEVNDETIVFNNLVDRKGELASHWEVPMRESWHARVF